MHAGPITRSKEWGSPVPSGAVVSLGGGGHREMPGSQPVLISHVSEFEFRPGLLSGVRSSRESTGPRFSF